VSHSIVEDYSKRTSSTVIAFILLGAAIGKIVYTRSALTVTRPHAREHNGRGKSPSRHISACLSAGTRGSFTSAS
jgi:hypothetical protein